MWEAIKRRFFPETEETTVIRAFTRIAEGAGILEWGFCIPAGKGKDKIVRYMLLGEEEVINKISEILDEHEF